MSTATKGRAAEHRTRKVLEAAGYTCVRSAASKGRIDLVAWNTQHLRLIQVKRGGGRATPLERELLQTLDRPPGTSVELWRWPLYSREPVIEIL